MQARTEFEENVAAYSLKPSPFILKECFNLSNYSFCCKLSLTQLLQISKPCGWHLLKQMGKLLWAAGSRLSSSTPHLDFFRHVLYFFGTQDTSDAHSWSLAACLYTLGFLLFILSHTPSSDSSFFFLFLVSVTISQGCLSIRPLCCHLLSSG